MLSLSAIYFTSFVMIIPVLIREDEGLQVPIVQRREMEPRYGGPSVLEETPYKLSIDKEVIKWCEKVNINIKGKGTICFKGFYFQVKDALNYTIGHFEPGRRIKLLDCSHQRRNIAMHDDPWNKTSINLRWVAPFTIDGPVRFLLTIVKEWEETWYFQQLKNISVINRPIQEVKRLK